MHKFFKRRHGATLIETMLAIAIIALLVFGSFAAITLNRIQSTKSRELNIMLDFGHHYLEVIRALPYERITPGYALNTIYDGTQTIKMPDGTSAKITVKLPANGTTWYSLTDASMLVFHPDLVFLTPRNPEYQCSISTQVDTKGNRARRVALSMRWNPPFGRGGTQTLNMSMNLYPDFQ